MTLARAASPHQAKPTVQCGGRLMSDSDTPTRGNLIFELTQCRLIRRFTDGSLEARDLSVDVPDVHIGLRFPAPVPGKVWEVREIIGAPGSPPALIAELANDG